MTPPSEWILHQEKIIKISNLSKQRCKSQMNTKIAKKTKIKLPPPWEKNNKLQILNKQHIKNEWINIIASPHSKPQIYFLVAIYVNQLQFPIIKLVWNMHYHTNSTYFSHFWSNIKRKNNKFLPYVASQMTAHRIIHSSSRREQPF